MFDISLINRYSGFHESTRKRLFRDYPNKIEYDEWTPADQIRLMEDPILKQILGRWVREKHIPVCDISNYDMSNKNYYRADFDCLNFRNVNLSNANLDKSSLVGTDLSGANLSNTNLMGCNAESAIFCGAKFYNTNFSLAFCKEQILQTLILRM